MRQLPTGMVTLLFADMEKSTQLLQQLGDQYTAVLADYRSMLRAVFRQWNGHEVDTQGDAFFVAFARASDAIAAAVAAQRALEDHAWPAQKRVRARMGLHTGEPVLVAEGYVGIDVHHAARIMSAAHGGQVLLSQITRDLAVQDLPAGVHLRDMGEHRLKDIQHAEHLFQLVIAGLSADFPALRALPTRINSLPVQSAPFVGRRAEIAILEQILRGAESRLITLTGIGGTGKTRLAVQAAAEVGDLFADGLAFVDLANVSDSALVLPTIASVLRLKEEGGQPLEERLKEELRTKQLLLLLDNFEQVIDAANQVAELLNSCPQLTLIVTSRVLLRIQAEREFVVPPLALPTSQQALEPAALLQSEAVVLFVQRAVAANPRFQLTSANTQTIVDIVACLDGLPLAIELAAARMKLLSPQELLARLGQRLRVLTDGPRDVAARQQTLRNALEWSYNLLTTEEQRLFWRLSVFSGGCTVESVEALCSELDRGTLSSLETLGSLLEKSLLQRKTPEAGEESRFTLLETIREYGLEVLAASGEREAVRRAHATYMLTLVQKAEAELWGPDPAPWLNRLEREHENVHAALHWALEGTDDREEMALLLGISLRAFWYTRGYRREGVEYLEQALARSEHASVDLRSKALYAAARLHEAQGNHERAEVLLAACLALFRAMEDTTNIASALHLQADIVWGKGNLSLARSLAEESLDLFRQIGDQGAIAGLLLHLGGVDADQGEYVRARALLEESLAIERKFYDEFSCAEPLFNLARVDFFTQQDPSLIRAHLEESLAAYKVLDDKESVAYCLWLFGRLALEQGDLSSARAFLQQSQAYFEEMRQRHGTTLALLAMARLSAVQGDTDTAGDFYQKSIALSRETSNILHTASALEGLADLAVIQGKCTWAARLGGAAEAMRDALSAPAPPVEYVYHERTMAVARNQLGEQLFVRAWARGREESLESVLQDGETLATIPKSRPTHP